MPYIITRGDDVPQKRGADGAPIPCEERDADRFEGYLDALHVARYLNLQLEPGDATFACREV